MATDNCDVVETAIEIGEGVYFNISNELYEWMWIIKKYFKMYGYNDYKDLFIICIVQPDKKQILNELDWCFNPNSALRAFEARYSGLLNIFSTSIT